VSGKCNVCTDGQPIVEVLGKMESGMSMAMARGSIKASSPWSTKIYGAHCDLFLKIMEVRGWLENFILNPRSCP
jgi:hypothetical protein